MKRLLGLLCAVVLLVSQLAAVSTASAAASAQTALYTRIDPSTGKVYNLKGKTVYIYDWWTGNDWHDDDPQTDAEKATHKYRKWLEKTYNCRIVVTAKGSWDTQVVELNNCVNAPDGNLCVFMVASDFMKDVILDDLAADWKKSVSINLSDSKWNKSTIKMLTFANGVYGVATGKSEPRQLLFFNKRVLEEAGIDWNSLYDMQKKGTWTWSEFTKLLKKIHTGDVYGMTGNTDDLYRIAMFSNGGSFFDLNDSGELVSSVNSDQSREALEWAKKTWNTYSAPRPEDAGWDWYKQYWKEGKTGFYIGQAWQGFNPQGEMYDMEDGWGAVAFPKGPQGSGYVTIVNNNVAVIPSNYSKQEITQVSLIYDLWTNAAPDLPDEEDDLGYLLELTDERAIYETYDMLRDDGHGVTDRTLLLGSVNEILGPHLLWSLSEADLDELITAAEESWEAYLKTLETVLKRLNKARKGNTLISGSLKYELDPQDKTAKVIGGKNKNIKSATIPDTVKSGSKKYKVTHIAEGAFKGYKKLAKVKIGKYVQSIGKDAFNGCSKLASVTGGTGLVVIGDGAFKGCVILTSFTLNKKVASIGDEAFYNCKKMKKYKILTVKLNADVIGKNAFKNNYKSVTFECPAKKLKAYKKLMPKKGAPKGAKYK